MGVHALRLLLDAAAVTTAQAAVLTIVAARENATQSDVADALGFNESAVTAMATRLLKLGLLERVRSATDGRAWCLRVSTAGQVETRLSVTGALTKIVEPGDFEAWVGDCETRESEARFSVVGEVHKVRENDPRLTRSTVNAAVNA